MRVVAGIAQNVLSVVVNFFNNRREAANTLFALSRAYQQACAALDFEVIALDHGSTAPLDEATVRGFGPEFHYRYIDTRAVSPAAAINAASADARGEQLMVLIDGAHLVTPHVYARAMQAFHQFGSPFIATPPFHLGPKQQNQSVLEGYDQATEDALLARIDWRRNGYRLYEIAGSFADGGLGWFGCAFESGCFALTKAAWLALGGFDERFTSRGGGLVNLDLFQRAVARDDLDYVMLLGEASFHQFHGGVASNAPAAQRPWAAFHDEYKQIRGRDFARVPRRPFLLGNLPNEALGAARVSAMHGLELWQKAVTESR